MMLSAAALALILAANGAASRAFCPPWPALDSVRVSSEDAVQVAGLLSLGMRRLAADLQFIRLLIYYGAEDPTTAAWERTRRGPLTELESGPRSYPQLEERTLRLLDLDPYFQYAAEYGAGALAFNIHRPEEAIAILRLAQARDPKNWKYPAYLAAIAFQKEGRPEQVRELLAPVARDPEAPTLLKHMLAYLDLRLGRREEAIRLYREIARSRDKNYAAQARRALAELGVSPST